MMIYPTCGEAIFPIGESSAGAAIFVLPYSATTFNSYMARKLLHHFKAIFDNSTRTEHHVFIQSRSTIYSVQKTRLQLTNPRLHLRHGWPPNQHRRPVLRLHEQYSSKIQQASHPMVPQTKTHGCSITCRSRDLLRMGSTSHFSRAARPGASRAAKTTLS